MTGPLEHIGRRVKLGPLGALSEVPFNVKVLADAGVIRPVRPDKLAAMARLLARWGASPAAGVAGAAVNYPDEPMIEDEAGSLTFAEVHRRSNAVARGLATAGVGEGDGVAIMCRNHRGFIEATLAVSKLGASGLYMNTAFAAPQLADVIEREEPRALIYDEELSHLLGQASEAGQEIGLSRYVAWSEPGDGEKVDTTLDELIESNGDADLEPPEEHGRFVILTSGTTGTPKGAQRAQPDTLSPLAALFSKIPLHARERTMIAAPLFHSWGFAHFVLGLALNSTYVLRRKFDPEETLRATQESGATALVVVPVMMQRIMELPEETLAKYDLPELRVTAASGSALPGELATRWMDRFGDNVYNLYGSTEVAWA
ncbi:MAG: AMP-binding protein, partial [Candidatus Limnocylindria bacterium]